MLIISFNEANDIDSSNSCNVDFQGNGKINDMRSTLMLYLLRRTSGIYAMRLIFPDLEDKVVSGVVNSEHMCHTCATT